MKLQHHNAVVALLSFSLIAGSDTPQPVLCSWWTWHLSRHKNPDRQIVKSDELSCITSPRKLVLTCWKTQGVDTLTRTAPARPCHTSVFAGCRGGSQGACVTDVLWHHVWDKEKQRNKHIRHPTTSQCISGSSFKIFIVYNVLFPHINLLLWIQFILCSFW